MVYNVLQTSNSKRIKQKQFFWMYVNNAAPVCALFVWSVSDWNQIEILRFSHNAAVKIYKYIDMIWRINTHKNFLRRLLFLFFITFPISKLGILYLHHYSLSFNYYLYYWYHYYYHYYYYCYLLLLSLLLLLLLFYFIFCKFCTAADSSSSQIRI